MPIDILVSEVGPRDGLQSIQSIMPLAAKHAWIAAEAAAGVREIEVGSFVPAKLLPQLADTAAVVAQARTPAGADGGGAGAQPEGRGGVDRGRRAQDHPAAVGVRDPQPEEPAAHPRPGARRGARHRQR